MTQPLTHARAAMFMTLTDAQRVLLEDKFVLWDRASREGPMDLRDYNRRAAEALKIALAICSGADGGAENPPEPQTDFAKQQAAWPYG